MNRQRPAPRAYPTVPKTWAVQPGAYVNIILKADQPTGRTVSGTIQDVLTRGNHPRGIKVRLADGRVGRVQSMVGGSAAPGSSSGDPGGVLEGSRVVDLQSGGGGGSWEEDVGVGLGSAGEGVPAQQIGLEAYIKEAKPKCKGKGKAKGGNVAAEASGVELATASLPLPPAEEAAPASTAEMATCPVCGEFEGDEAAVSHHVAEHFDAN